MESLIDSIAGLGHWSWWIMAVLLVIIEVFAPSTFFLWLGISAGVVGLFALIAPESGWKVQWILFAIISIGSIIASRFFMKTRPLITDNPTLNKRGSQYIGRKFEVIEAIVNGRGKIHVDDSQWVIEGDDAELGSIVRVTAVDGTYLKVETVQE